MSSLFTKPFVKIATTTALAGLAYHYQSTKKPNITNRYQKDTAHHQTLTPLPQPPVNENKTALVVGLGIAGMSVAIGLKKAGWQPIIVERAESRRTGGYFIGLLAEAFEAAKYFGIDKALVTRTPEDYTTWEIDKDNQRHPGVRFNDQPNHPEVVLRGDIEEALWTGIVTNDIPVCNSPLK